MPISGQNVAQQLARALQDTQSELAEARQRASLNASMVADIHSDRDRTLAELAKFYLPGLTRDSLLQMWSETRPSIEQILLKKEQHIASLERELADLDTTKRNAEADLDSKSVMLDKLLEQQQSIATKLSQVLSQDALFVELTEKAAAAEAALERAESSLEQIEHEANQKLPAYENSKLFLYLYRRGLATPAYQARGFTQRMDRWVGRLIEYPTAKIGYEYLKSMPDQVRTLVAHDRQALDQVMGELEQRRDSEGAKLGMPEIVAQVQQADQEHREALAQLDEIRLRTDQSRAQLADVSRPDGPYYEEAIKFFTTLLENTEKASLEARARRTPDPHDDQIVAKLHTLDGDARQANTAAAKLQQRVVWLDKHLTELGALQQRFRSLRYDSSQSEFDGLFDLQADLRIVREGQDTVDNVWNRLKRTQRFAPSPLETVGSGLAGAASHPLTQVLVHAMATAASSSMVDHAKKAGSRHAKSSSTPSRPAQTSSSVRPSQPKPPSGGGFYTSRKF